jgi:hypothetical protein
MQNQPKPNQPPVYEQGAEAKKNFAAAMSAIVSTDPSKRIETAHHVIHLEPRMSAAKFAEYAVADHSRKETLVRSSKKASKAVMIPYKYARAAIPHALTPTGLDSDYLLRRANEIEVMPVPEGDGADWVKSDYKRSADALRRVASLAKSIECVSGTIVSRPPRGWGYLNLGGVKVSVNPDLVFTITERGVTKVGAVILATGQNSQLALDRSNGRYSVGDYLTVILYRLIEANLKAHGVPARSRCYAVDVFRSKVYAAPASHKTMLKHLEAAGKSVFRDWNATPAGGTTAEIAINDDGEDPPF